MRRLANPHLWLAALTLVAIGLPGMALAADAGQTNTNLLQNPGFEAGVAPGPNGRIGAGWTPWFVAGSENDQASGFDVPPTYDVVGGAVQEGSRAQTLYHAFAAGAGGVYQQVTVPANARVRFEAYVRGYSCRPFTVGTCPETSLRPTNLRIQAGIAATSGTDFFAPGVITSFETSSLDRWTRLAVETNTRQSTIVTVFLKYQPTSPVERSQVWFDQTSLTVISGGAEAATATPTPTGTQTQTAVPEGSYVVQGGDTLGGIAKRFGTTLSALINLNTAAHPSLATNPDVIYAGWVLNLPGESTTTAADTSTSGATPTPTQEPLPSGLTTLATGQKAWVVGPGDSLLEIAKANDVTVPKIVALNIDTYPSLGGNPDVIYQGWVLVLE